MSFRVPVILFCILFAVIGCDQFGGFDTPHSQQTETVETPATEPVSHYEQLLRKRLDFELKIREAMNLYRTTHQKVRTQRTQLKQSVGDIPVPEAIELFSKGNTNEIPSNLRVGYSLWRTTLMPEETLLRLIDAWLEKQLKQGGTLEELDRIMHIESNQRMDDRKRDEFDRVFALSVDDWTTIDVVSMALIEQEVIEKQISADWE